MPADRRLSVLVAQPGYPTDALTSLIRLLVRFRDESAHRPDIDRAGTATALRARWRSLLDPLHETPIDLVDPDLRARIVRRAMRYLDGRVPLLDQRIAEGRIVDGHGDLLAEDIFELSYGFHVLDCLDFDDRLRYVDRLDDIAFLAMDFESLGRADLADRFVDEYLRESADSAPASLRDHYVAYRATVRAKVDLIRACQGDRTATDRVRGHLALADRRLARGAVRLTAIGGLPGTGKSTVAAELSARTGAVLISSDHVRNELARDGAMGGHIGRFGAGRYSPANKARVYDEILWRAEVLLASGVPVILDASWTDPEQRRRAAALAEFVALQCVCPAELADRRIRERRGSESDATPQIAQALAATSPAWPVAVDIDTTGCLADSVASACRVWHDAPGLTAVPVRCPA
ncbi:AAA family ATPase [Nocardia fluminea]|uniref:AAA family ATPase n=1 Tax=Nocardia fluminea TaxID=134984 RepID=UPI003D0BE577